MVPMVTTIDGRPRRVTSAPFIAPQSEADAEADRDEDAACRRRACAAKPIAVEASAMIAATERSISPAMMSSAMAKAIIAFSVKLKVASREVPGAEEVGRGEAVDDEDRHGDREQQRLPALQQRRAARACRRSGMTRGVSVTVMRVLRLLQDDPAARPLGAGVEGDGDDDRGAGDRQLPEGRDVDDRQRVLDDAEEQRAHARRRRPSRCRRRSRRRR